MFIKTGDAQPIKSIIDPKEDLTEEERLEAEKLAKKYSAKKNSKDKVQ
jgi:hypothetical protein